ncbi:MAG TPA: roadblock/LC7 domain-containing protein [Gemmatimonadaceae bacterium]|nr:roadblock/LC7 domain-containing protein [Gemmatimonadaceae bacterium]
MTSPFEELLASLIRHRGVLGCMVVGESDGIIVDANVQVGIQANLVAALAAALYRKARLSSEAAGLTSVNFLQLEAERGQICAAGRDGLVIVTVAEPRAQIGLIRGAMLQSVEALA